jgi:hypothetical protein
MNKGTEEIQNQKKRQIPSVMPLTPAAADRARICHLLPHTRPVGDSPAS